jgi:hypothetical protein
MPTLISMKPQPYAISNTPRDRVPILHLRTLSTYSLVVTLLPESSLRPSIIMIAETTPV